MKLHHIGIAVKELEAASSFLENILRRQFSEPEIVDSQKVKVSYAGNIELIQATQDQSPLHSMMKHPILNFIEKNGEGVHHLCFEVEDLDAALEELTSKGIKTLTEKPQQGSSNSRIIFLNPKFCNNMLIELKEVRNE
jgi:methylmalonyl-CoA/ethylmalonyl-CoA epimerase